MVAGTKNKMEGSWSASEVKAIVEIQATTIAVIKSNCFNRFLIRAQFIFDLNPISQKWPCISDKSFFSDRQCKYHVGHNNFNDELSVFNSH
jgi:hypothetical protein